MVKKLAFMALGQLSDYFPTIWSLWSANNQKTGQGP
jgi:hypothetical protein